MMETILFSFILILIIIWIMLGILYFYMRYVSPYGILIKKNKKGNEQTKENEATKKKDGQKGEGTEDQAEFVLIGKSRSTSPIIPQVPSASSLENSKQNSNNFVTQNSENKDDMKEEDNEMEVSYEMEREDENEVAREELSLPIESASEDGEVSSQSILARDLGRMRKWRKNSDEVDDAEVKEIVGQLKGTDFMEKYKEYVAKMQGEQSILLDKIRSAEEGEEQTDELSTFDASRKNSSDNLMTETDDMGERPLSYYL
ncbi:hypothetical protein ETF27_02185 [Prevotella brunnea]|uniref:Uncharacterized protein n=1 Tax=Prevotella brunnea TaxID=2508867 RepID=A0A5C8GLZ2_9BACT|nr:hypothetical protein [Prevotella brunnea]MDR0186372.1 hypothetical protein [Prevotella brunnea]TXJ62975.1 hypothetical protein ETF27_02185 [Prevotella brunnea]